MEFRPWLVKGSALRIFRKFILVFLGLLASLVLGEVAVRVAGVGSGLFKTAAETQGAFQADTELGYRPVPGGEYSEYGCVQNSYAVSQKKGFRILFAGDSVTHRGGIPNAVGRLHPEFEVWNAGVEGYNPIQELAFYERFNRKIEPDQIVLTLHNNDYMVGPVAFRDNGKAMVSLPHRSPSEFQPWLFSHSSLYRALVTSVSREDHRAYVARVDSSLEQFKARAASSHCDFLVLVLPPLKPRAEWSSEEEASYTHAIDFLQRVEIAHFDLSPSMESAIKEGVVVEAAPGDTWHPSLEMSEIFARALDESGMLGPTARY